MIYKMTFLSLFRSSRCDTLNINQLCRKFEDIKDEQIISQKALLSLYTNYRINTIIWR